MKVTVPYPVFASAFKLAARVSSRDLQPIMRQVCIQASADSGIAALTASDFENHIDIQLPHAMVAVGGTAMLDPEIVKAAFAAGKGAESVTIEGNATGSKIKVGKQTFAASDLNAADFMAQQIFAQPTIGPAIGSIQCETALLAYGLKTALVSVSTDDTRPALMGVSLETDGSRLTMVATDGRRLHKTAFPAAISTTEERLSIIVPSRGGELIQHIITGLDTEITVHRADVREDVQLTTPTLGNRGQVTLRVRLINASVPNYEAVIPAPNPDKTITVAASDLCEAVQVICKTEISLADLRKKEACVFFETDRSPGLKLYGETVKANSPDDFQLAVISSDVRQQGAVQLRFNPYFWLDLCQVIEESSYSLQLIDEMRPVVVRPTDEPADLDTLFLIMPTRV